MNKTYRRPLIAGNWKMNRLPSEAEPYIERLKNEIPRERSCDIVLCVPFTVISSMVASAADENINVGAQDVSFNDFGAYTGEIAAETLSDLKVTYCIVGHSERRAYHAETDADVNKKAKKLLSEGLTPIICVGESLEQREAGIYPEFVTYQAEAALAGLDSGAVSRCVIAYEPIWAIGTGKSIVPEQAEEVCRDIRGAVSRKYGESSAEAVRILYGGSMNPGNCADILAQPNIDGGLIGGASLKPADFGRIIMAADGGAN